MIISPPLIGVTSIKVVVTLLDGTIISDVVSGNGQLNGKTKIGGFGKVSIELRWLTSRDRLLVNLKAARASYT